MVDNGRDRARSNVANDWFDQRLPQSFIGEQPVRQGGDRLGAVITRVLRDDLARLARPPGGQFDEEGVGKHAAVSLIEIRQARHFATKERFC